MTDLSRLTEALAWWDRMKGPDFGKAIPVLAEAARLVVDGQDERWCEEHHLPRAYGIEEVCVVAYMPSYDPDLDPCHIVPARLIYPASTPSSLLLWVRPPQVIPNDPHPHH